MGPARCAAVDCATPVPAGMALCRRHWAAVPSALRREVLAESRRGGGDALLRAVAAAARRDGLPYRAVASDGSTVTSGVTSTPLALDLGGA